MAEKAAREDGKIDKHMIKKRDEYMTFSNRMQAGVLLAKSFVRNALKSAVVIGLARGGVPVAAAIASALQIPVDVMVVKKSEAR